MNEGTESDHGQPDSEEGEDSMRSLVRGALKDDAPPGDVLAGVQKKLRDRSGGKFYDDEWSTAKKSPTLTFLVTGALMFVIVLATWAVLGPLRGHPERVNTAPVPIEVLPPMHS
jgi:hypothetical protein